MLFTTKSNRFSFSTIVESGASGIVPTKFASWGNFAAIGYPPDKYDTNGIQWVSLYKTQTELLINCASETDPAECVLTALSIKSNEWDMFHYDWGNPTVINRVLEVHVFSTKLNELNLRMTSGNEQGTDHSLWKPGGYTSNGLPEAVIDRFVNDQYCWNAVTMPDGTFCYDNCDIICDDVAGCKENHCVENAYALQHESMKDMLVNINNKLDEMNRLNNNAMTETQRIVLSATVNGLTFIFIIAMIGIATISYKLCFIKNGEKYGKVSFNDSDVDEEQGQKKSDQ